jgi:hypothetical protein
VSRDSVSCPGLALGESRVCILPVVSLRQVVTPSPVGRVVTPSPEHGHIIFDTTFDLGRRVVRVGVTPGFEGKPNANHVRARIRTHVHSDYINDLS